MVRVVGREALLGEVVTRLRQGESVALHGPQGVGKSALLDTIEELVRSDREVEVIRANGAPDERALPYAALRDLISQVPREVTQTLPDRLRHYAEEGLVGLVGLAATDEVRSDLGAVPSTRCWTPGRSSSRCSCCSTTYSCSTASRPRSWATRGAAWSARSGWSRRWARATASTSTSAGWSISRWRRSTRPRWSTCCATTGWRPTSLTASTSSPAACRRWPWP